MREYSRKTDQKAGIAATAKTAQSRISGLKQNGKRSGAKKEAEMFLACEDYRNYRFSRQEWIRYLMLYTALDACISYLFFFSWIAFAVLLPGIVLFLKERRQMLQRKRAGQIRRQFMDGMQILTASLQAGYSVENSLVETSKELARVYGPETFIMREFRRMEAQLAVNRNIEEIFMDFGQRCAIDDIQSFAEVFLTAKRSGGDLIAVVRNTISCMHQKQETMQEIETCLAGKVMEQNIMSMIPLLILAYVKVTSPRISERHVRKRNGNGGYDTLLSGIRPGISVGQKNCPD